MRINSPQLEVNDLAAVIRDAMGRQTPVTNNAAPQPLARENGAQSLKLQPEFQPRADHRYHINDLLQYHDRAFVQAAYRAVLKRSPDEGELLRDLKRLRTGYVNKIDLLADLRHSAEGKARKVQIDGLTLPATMRRLGQLPLIGYPIRLAIAFLRLPNSVRDQREFAGYVLAQNQQIADFINQMSFHLTERADWLAADQQTLAAEQRAAHDAFTRQQADLERAGAQRHDQLAQHLDTSIAQSAKQLNDLRVRLGDVNNPELDTLYAALEDRFRGTRDEIKERFREYLPYVKDNSPVVDLGCGRGEWLELLREAGIEARGVDQNRLQVEQCRALGLDVTERDFLTHLQSLPAASTGAITGFHIIEHVPFTPLVTLLDEVRRVLRPGGVVIFETPNPENIVVASNYFYLDPSHRHPLPRELMEFLLKSRGFDQIEVLNLHPWESGRIPGNDALTERFNGYFYGPMDYAVVGRKVAS